MAIDLSLLEKCKSGRRRAQHDLYVRCYPIMMAICQRYERNKDDAESLLNQAFLKVLNKLDIYKEEIPFDAWVRRITINTAIDELRRKKRSKLDYMEEPSDVGDLSKMDYNQAELNFNEENLLRLIRKLPPLSQKVFNLYVIDGYSHQEIAQQLKMSEGTSKWHLSNARKKLKAFLHKLMNNVALLL